MVYIQFEYPKCIARVVLVNINGKITDRPDPGLCTRAAQFGDGFFETMMWRAGQLMHEPYHLLRIDEAAKALRFTLSSTALINEIKRTANSAERKNARIKLMVWRKTDQRLGYSTSTTDVAFQIEVKAASDDSTHIVNKVELSSSVRLYPSATSGFKTLSSLPYVLVAIERDERDLEEIILTDIHGNLGECSSSNLFWINNNQLYTPALASGCINGIMRRLLMDKFEVNETLAATEVLNGAESIFCTNVARLTIFSSWQSHVLKTDSELLRQLKQLWAP